MAVMKVSRMMRDGPAGNPLNINATAGAKVKVLDDRALPWTKIKLVDPPQTEGWVSDEAIDKSADTLGPLDKQLVARTCVEQGAMFGANAYYLMTLAQLRTNISDFAAADDPTKGLFRFSAKEWELNSAHPEVHVTFTPADLLDWRAQCAQASIMAAAAQIELEARLQRSPTMIELLFAQLLGIDAAASGLSDTTKPLRPIIDAAIAGAQAARIDAANLGGRDAAMLAGETVANALAAIENVQQSALDTSRTFVRAQAEIFNTLMQQLAPVATGDIRFDSSEIPTSRRQIAQLIAQKFAAAGYGTLQQIAAIANAIRESRLKPDATNLNGERSFGLFQLNQNGGVGFGHPASELLDPARNIEIMIEEIAKPYQKKARQAFIGAPTLHEAVRIFVFEFERPANKSSETEKRFAIAQKLVM